MKHNMEAYATLIKLVYEINEAYEKAHTNYRIFLTVCRDNYIILNLYSGEDKDPVSSFSTSCPDKAIDMVVGYANAARAALGVKDPRKNEIVSKHVAWFREEVKEDGFTMAQEAWDNIFQECMDNFEEWSESWETN